jgi:hypothetical protein
MRHHVTVICLLPLDQVQPEIRAPCLISLSFHGFRRLHVIGIALQVVYVAATLMAVMNSGAGRFVNTVTFQGRHVWSEPLCESPVSFDTMRSGNRNKVNIARGVMR